LKDHRGEICEMKDEQAANLRDLLASRSTAALGTLHSGAPYVSMVPFVLLRDGIDGAFFAVHVSRLAAHTNDMLAEPRVSLLITASEQVDVLPQALSRVTILGTARQISSSSPEYPAAREAYLARFPDTAAMFQLGDFSLFLITPTEVRWVAGFAQARSLSPLAFARAVRETSD
jgi:putative heme iron utilization protein